MRTLSRVLCVLVAVLLVAACESSGENAPLPPDKGDSAPSRQPTGRAPSGSLFGDEGLSLFKSEKDGTGDGGAAGIGVNSYLWRASLDTISFMPVTSADPFGGVIITDWHTPAGATNERFKMNVYILGRQLRADGVRVSVFRQVRDGGEWYDSEVPPETATKIEDAILTRARQLRAETMANQ